MKYLPVKLCNAFVANSFCAFILFPNTPLSQKERYEIVMPPICLEQAINETNSKKQVFKSVRLMGAKIKGIFGTSKVFGEKYFICSLDLVIKD